MDEHQWDDNLMSLGYLIRTEVETATDTLRHFSERDIEIRNLINLFFRLPYHCNEPVVQDSDDQYFMMIANNAYYRLPNTLQGLRRLWLQGHYLEGAIVYRHLLEGFVTLRYFHTRRDRVRRHIDPNDRRRIPFRQMFDDCAPGLYVEHYGFLSNIVHGGIAADVFRAEYQSPTEGRLIMGSEFNRFFSAFVHRLTILICYGYANYFEVFYPSARSSMDATLLDRTREMLDHLHDGYLSAGDNLAQTILPLVER